MTKAEQNPKGSVAGGVTLLVVARAEKPSVSSSPVASKIVATWTPAAVPVAATASVAAADEIPPLPANASSIPDEYLQKLGLMVDPSGAALHNPDKAQWAKAMPVAKKLVEGPCDCAQRVWLKRFIEMGDFAMADSKDQYTKAAQFIATIGRNDEQAMALSHSRSVGK